MTPDTATYEERMKAGEGDLWVELGNQNDANPCFLPALLFRTGAPAEDYAKLFAPGEAFDQFVDACQEAVTPEEVASSAANAMKVIIEDEHVIVPIAGVFRIYGMQDTVQDFVANPSRTSQRWELVSIGQ